MAGCEQSSLGLKMKTTMELEVDEIKAVLALLSVIEEDYQLSARELHLRRRFKYALTRARSGVKYE